MGGGALGHAARTQIDAEGDVLPRFQHVLAGPGIRDAAMDRPRHVQRRQNPTLGGVRGSQVAATGAAPAG